MIGGVALTLALVTAPSNWQRARWIVLPTLRRATYVRLTLPQSVGGSAAERAQLRIVDRRDREVPYALDADPRDTSGTAATLFDVGFTPGRFTQAFVDLGRSGALHDALTLQIPPLATDGLHDAFFERVEIASSVDRRTWSVLTSDALIYRISGNDAQNTRVDFGPSRARWLRIRVLDGARRFPIAGATVPASNAPARLVPLSAGVRWSNLGGRRIAQLDFGGSPTEVAALAFETSTPEFSRSVVVDGTLADASGAATLAEATISRFAAGRPQLTVPLQSSAVKRLRVSVIDGNDAPLAQLRVTALGYRHDVVFRALPGERYRLLWDNPQTRAPRYDLDDRLAHAAWTVGAVAALGGAATTAFQPNAVGPTTPWLVRAALPLALVLAALVLGGVAFAALRKAG